VRELAPPANRQPGGDPPEHCGWGDRQGLHPSFTEGGYGNQINHFALALRLFEVHRLPYAPWSARYPPQDPAARPTRK
jgi:hypothetical protein